MFRSVFKNLKIFFIIFASSITLASVILIFIFIKNQENQNSTISYVRNLKEISVNFENLNKVLQVYRDATHPNDFYIYKHDTYSEKIYTYLNLIKTEIKKRNKETSVMTFDISIKFNEIKDNISDFETDFELLNENIVKLGNYENGFTENIIQTQEKTDKILKSYPQFYNQFQKLKKSKSDLLSIGNKKNKNLFLEEKKDFLTYLKLNRSIFKNTSEKQIVINSTADWINTVLQYSKLQQINGSSYSPGLYDKLEHIIYDNEKIISDIQNIILAKFTDLNRKFFINFVLLSILFTVIFIMIGFYIYTYIKKRFDRINRKLSELVPLRENNNINFSEFEKTNFLIHQLIQDTKNKTEFIKKMKSENLEQIKININSSDIIGKALIDFKDFLLKEKIRQKNNEQIKAVSEKHKDGIIKFGKIIRQHFGNIDNLTFDLLSELVHFLDADIGGIYVLDKKENPEILKLRAFYAYDEKKILNKEIKIGEGLVGTCAADKSSVYIDRIDDDYIKIVSGFGHTKPKNLLLSPIFAENEIFGVIELASVGRFTPDDIKFIETLAEDIAYTLAYLLK